MDNIIVCNIDMFSLLQPVNYGEGVEYLKTEDLFKTLNKLCYSKNIYKVHFFGNKDYIEGIVSEMFADEITHYGKNKIEVEVN